MAVIRRHRMAPRFLLSGLVFAILGTLAWAQAPIGPQEPPPPPEPQAPPPLDAPRAEPLPATPDAADAQAPDRGASRESRAEGAKMPAAPAGRVYVPHEPPPPIAERPSGDRPGPKTVWTPGYWEWDPDESRFVWVAGSWRVPPAGMVWTSGRWQRDANGWYWMPGSWTRRADRAAIAATRPAWRINGPPAEHPDDAPPPAPGPDFFYVPGHYAPSPAGNRVTWVPGFWAAIQPGWDWIPARWVRRADGWDFREGRWIRDPATAVAERVPGRNLRRGRRDADVTVIARDPTTEAEVDFEAAGDPIPAGAVATGAPYYVLRPPGYPYGPSGVVVPGAVPPFVRRILDRVLP
jgi:WXXGXW repeat (2 copies)